MSTLDQAVTWSWIVSQGWHIGEILPITDMSILIYHHRYIDRYLSLIYWH